MRTLFRTLLFLGLTVTVLNYSGCGGQPPPTNGNGTPTTSDNITVQAGQNRDVPAAGETVTGDVTVEGTLEAAGDKLVLTVDGDLTVNGTIQSGAAAAAGVRQSSFDPTKSLRNQTEGIYIVVKGNVQFGENSQIISNGPIVITDDDTQLDRIAQDVYDEADSDSGDLPTLVPLPITNDTNGQALAAAIPAPAPFLGSVDTRQASVTRVIQGVADLRNAQGDKPTFLFRFNNVGIMVIKNYQVLTPAGVSGASKDNSTDPNDQGTDAAGGKGKNGMNLNFWNNNGPIDVEGNFTVTLTDGGAGGDATVVCATATGGEGGKAGNFRMTAAGGIDITKGKLTINPGKGGKGGNATATGTKGAIGCAGTNGCPATAIGGKGSDNKKRLRVRGNVQGLANVTIAKVTGGDGGTGTATGGEGGDGLECCDGGDGGKGTATGGKGGDASVDVGTLAVTSAGAEGGAGGNATATGGDGGDGGDCKTRKAGDGGDGSDSAATGGAGGAATASGGGGNGTGGKGGNATANGGTGGDGGDSAIQPGIGGAFHPTGQPKATKGTGGTGGTAGADGTETTTPTKPGNNGGPMVIVSFCFGFDFLAQPPHSIPDGLVPPGTYTGPLFDEPGQTQVGTLPIHLVDSPGAQFFRMGNPDHIGISGGTDGATFETEIVSMELTGQSPVGVVGVRLAPLSGEGLGPSSPLRVRGLDSQGLPIGPDVELPELPDNLGSPDNPELVDVLLPGEQGRELATIQIEVPGGAFVTILRIYILDP